MNYARLKTHSTQLLPMAHTKIPAGPAVEISESHHLLDVTALVTKGREGFVAYIVTGDSMATYIPQGAVVFVDTWAEPRSGDIVAASIDGAVSIKEFCVKERKLYLVPRNRHYKPREVKEDDNLCILGVVKGSLSMFG